MIFAISDETWEKLIYALIPLLVALTAWLRGEYKDWLLERRAEKAEVKAEAADIKADTLAADVRAGGIETTLATRKVR